MTGFGHAEQRRRLGALRSEQLRSLDSAAPAAGVPLEALMETAGWQLARLAWRLLGRRPAGVLVCAGRGNNGGDALVVARQLAGWGCEVRVLLVSGDAGLNPLLQEQRERLRAATGIEAVAVRSVVQAADVAGSAAPARLVVDGLLGTGLRGAPRALDAAVIEALVHPNILSVDVPSGLDADEGTAAGACVRARTTCTLTAMKRGLWTAEGRSYTGTLFVADIGMPPSAWDAAELPRPGAVRGGAVLRVPVPLD